MKNSSLFLTSLLIFSVLFVGFWSCQHDPIVPDNNTNPIVHDSCDTNLVYFENQILPIFQSSCAYSGCHDQGSHKEGIVLNSYANIMGSGIVLKNQPFSSKVYEVITAGGGDNMPPPPKAPLSAGQIELIKKWIEQGAQNNRCDGCDTLNVHFNATILPIVQNSCQGCHSGSTPSKNVSLTNYTQVKAIVDDGRLVKVLHGTGGLALMPPGGALSSCKLTQFSIWINNGAKND